MPSDTSEQKQQKADRRRVAAFALGKLISDRLEDYRPVRWTQRPATLPDDPETWAAIERVRQMVDRAARVDREVVKDFRMWRGENMRAADQLARHLEMLIFAVQSLEAVEDAAAAARARRVREHLRHRFDVESFSAEPAREQALELARKLCPLPAWAWEIKRPAGAFDPGAHQ